jgi:hypothetical protein
MATGTTTSDFPGAFIALRNILKRHADGMIVLADKPTEYTLASPGLGPNGKPMWFGCVLSKKSAVTYHLMPLYYNPKLQSAISPELLARKQGKTCFNFKHADPVLFAQLDALTKQGREQWQRLGFLEPGPIPPERFADALRAGGHDPAALMKVRAAKGKAAAANRSRTLRKQPGRTSDVKRLGCCGTAGRAGSIKPCT